jgi:HPt (histidine-containing phosphotransfer) domain-containing protein
MHYATRYSCSGHDAGGACTNSARVRRLAAEEKILAPLRDELLAPAVVRQMAKEMETLHAQQLAQTAARAEKAPGELEELRARIERLRERLRQGDPDMTTDEIQAAVDRAEGKRQELEQAQPASKASARVVAAIPRAAALYREQVARGLDGTPARP